jgi:putative oxidoreductase
MSTEVISAGGRRMNTSVLVFSWACRITAAVILLQTLFFKFTAAPESVYIFSKVGAEPWGRIGSGVVELIAAILLLTPRFAWAGAFLGLGVMTGAIISHLTILGIEVQGDKGLLFSLAIAVFVTSAITLYLHRGQIPVIGSRL